MRITAIASALAIAVVLAATSPAWAQEESQYKKFKMDNETTNAAVMYKVKPDGMDVAVSAVTYGKGAEFRKWEVTDIRLRIAGEAVRPDSYGRFYVTKESIFRYPAAVLFAVIGAMSFNGCNSVGQGITAAGLTIGMGLLATQAKGEITGQNASFKLSGELADKIGEGDAIEITAEDKDLHLKDVIRTGLVNPSGVKETVLPGYASMDRNAIFIRMQTMKSEIGELEARQESYKYGEDPEYDDIQRKIESLETERGLAYRAWYTKQDKI